MDIYEGLLAHSKKEKASFHMPGHKNGAAYFGTPLFSETLKLDTTELVGTDCLHNPDGIIKKAQENAAFAYHADKAYFLVNGATGGILSMFYAAFKKGDKVIVDRNCHKSAISAMVLCGARPVYITPEENEACLVSGKISPEKLEEIFKAHSDIKGVYVTSPNYYGICSDLEKIADIAHKNNALLLVDEAHGAHFPFSPAFPKNAMECGADLSVCSLHKTLAAPNQAALLCKKGNLIDEEKLTSAFLMFTTTSPSYILLAYSDAAICNAQNYGDKYTKRYLELAKSVKSIKTDDPFKIILSFKENGISGFEAEKIMREKFGIFAELKDHANVLLIGSWANSADDFALLSEAQSYLSQQKSSTFKECDFPKFTPVSNTLSPFEVYNLPTVCVKPDDAVGKISAKAITTFPPCIPLILPGERITREQAEFLKTHEKSASGIFEGKVFVIK